MSIHDNCIGRMVYGSTAGERLHLDGFHLADEAVERTGSLGAVIVTFGQKLCQLALDEGDIIHGETST